MSIQITIDLPEAIFPTLPQDPKELAQQMRLAAAIKWYELQLISQTQAAEIAGVNHHTFKEALTHFSETSPSPNSEYLTAMHAYLNRHAQPLFYSTQTYPSREERYERTVLLR